MKRRQPENKEVLLIRVVRYINYTNQSFYHIIKSESQVTDMPMFLSVAERLSLS